MTHRAILVSLFAACAICLPAAASQPGGYAGKLISNPAITPPPIGEDGLPSVTCLGFSWFELVSAIVLDPADTVTLEFAVVPFRTGGTEVLLPELLRVRFADGLINGLLPYHRTGWNDVRVVFRPATQDYMLTLNGVEAGPFPNEFPCVQAACFTLQAVVVRGATVEESVAWIDSLRLVRRSAAGEDLVLENGFDQCYAGQNVGVGGLLISEPPQRFTPGGCPGGNR